MAEEKIEGLEGLDDFGDDFSEQLDSFMEDEGEDESDSELDSFFEDLSTIDDLEDDEEAEIEDDKKANDTGDSVTGRQIPHSLSKTPEMIWLKCKVGENWAVYHIGLNGGTNPHEKEILLNSSNNSLIK